MISIATHCVQKKKCHTHTSHTVLLACKRSPLDRQKPASSCSIRKLETEWSWPQRGVKSSTLLCPRARCSTALVMLLWRTATASTSLGAARGELSMHTVLRVLRLDQPLLTYLAIPMLEQAVLLRGRAEV